MQESKSTSSEPIDSSQPSNLSLSRSKDFTYGTLSTLKTKPEIFVSANFPNQMINLSNSQREFAARNFKQTQVYESKSKDDQLRKSINSLKPDNVASVVENKQSEVSFAPADKQESIRSMKF